MVYVHVPFCKSFCTYCDFYSELCSGKDSGKVQKLYVDAVCAEAQRRMEEIEAASQPRTLYLGGGTPSLLDLDSIGAIVDAVGQGPYEEFTVEVNPEDIVEKGVAYAEGLLELGVTRVSMGVQSLDDGILRWMNRRHDAAGAVTAFGILRDAGVNNISIDLIFGLSQLTLEQLDATLDGFIRLCPEHISAYQLSVEDGSALAAMVADGRYAEATEEQCKEQYDFICGRLRAGRYHHYEVSNWARPGFEAVHNSAYWIRVPYVGLGPGAHSFDGRVRSWNSDTIYGYSAEREVLSAEDSKVESIMLGLRTSAGLDASWLRNAVPGDTLSRLMEEGSLQERGGRIRIPEQRFFVSDSIIRALI